MKRIFIVILIYFWGRGVFLPVLYHLITGQEQYTLYSTYSIPTFYITLTAIIISFVVFVSILIIAKIPDGNARLEPVFDYGSGYYYMVFVITIGGIFLAAGSLENVFSVIINGQLNGTAYGYITMFMEPYTLLLVYLLGSKRKFNIWILEFLYVIYSFSFGSRAGMLWGVVSIACFYFASKRYREYRKQIVALGGIFVLFAPFLFIFATKNRGGTAGAGIKEIADTIVSRLSVLEHGALALMKWMNGTYEADIFQEKYGLAYQLKIVINRLVPGDLFPVNGPIPSVYYRSCFLGLSEEIAAQKYNSDDLTFPVYLTIKYGFIVGILLCIVIIVGLYCICRKYRRYLVTRSIAVMTLFNILDFFDWYMVFNGVFLMSLTTFLFWFVREKLSKKVKLPRIRITL